MQFNDDVLAEIKPLPGLTVFDVPIFSALQTIVSNPARFGFANVTGPCISGNFESPGPFARILTNICSGTRSIRPPPDMPSPPISPLAC